jgi:hypothetical protein
VDRRKSYVLYKTENLIIENQQLIDRIPQCGIMLFMMRNFAALHHGFISYHERHFCSWKTRMGAEHAARDPQG